MSQLSTLPQIAADLNNLGVQLHESKNHTAAAQLYKDALHAMKDFVDTSECDVSQVRSARVWHKKLMTQRKVAQIQCCESGNPSSSPPIQRQADTLVPAPIAINSCDKHIDDDEELSAVVLYNLGLVHFERSFFDVAGHLFHVALSLRSSDKETGVEMLSLHYVSALLWTVQGREEEAMGEFVAALHVQVNDSVENGERHAWVLNRIGRILISKGHIRDAIEIFHAALLTQTRIGTRCGVSMDADETSAASAA